MLQSLRNNENPAFIALVPRATPKPPSVSYSSERCTGPTPQLRPSDAIYLTIRLAFTAGCHAVPYVAKSVMREAEDAQMVIESGRIGRHLRRWSYFGNHTSGKNIGCVNHANIQASHMCLALLTCKSAKAKRIRKYKADRIRYWKLRTANL